MAPSDNEPARADNCAGLLDLLARDHMSRARQLRRMAEGCRHTEPALLRTVMYRRASECESSGKAIRRLAERHRAERDSSKRRAGVPLN